MRPHEVRGVRMVIAPAEQDSFSPLNLAGRRPLERLSVALEAVQQHSHRDPCTEANDQRHESVVPLAGELRKGSALLR